MRHALRGALYALVALALIALGAWVLGTSPGQPADAEEAELTALGVPRSEVTLSVRHTLSGTFVRVARRLADGRPLIGPGAVVRVDAAGTTTVYGALGAAPASVLEAELDDAEIERIAPPPRACAALPHGAGLPGAHGDSPRADRARGGPADRPLVLRPHA